MNHTHVILDGRSKTQMVSVREDCIYGKLKRQLKLNYIFWGITNINGKHDLEKQGKDEYKFKSVLPGGGAEGVEVCVVLSDPCLKVGFLFHPGW